jgi:NADH-quinone oxidoreductase subunit J
VTENIFYFLSFVAVLSALLVVFSRNPVYSVLYLIITFFCITGLYVILDAQFLAVINIIVYSGAIMVLFLYVIMLLNLNKESEPHKSTFLKIAATVSAGLFLLVVVSALKGTETIVAVEGAQTDIGSVKSLGYLMFTEFLLPFEVTSLLLLTAMVGAVMIGKARHKGEKVEPMN